MIWLREDRDLVAATEQQPLSVSPGVAGLGSAGTSDAA
jgi:hypothetical protein